jgi:glycosyltransferase involved in cell wall biosynthesis
VHAFTPIENKKSNLFTILSIGRIDPSKNVDLIIDAVQELVSKHPELQYKMALRIIGGPGLKSNQDYFQMVKSKAQELEQNILVDFVGPVPNNATISYYQNADLFINISDTGGLDKVVLEAMACKTIVLTSNNTFQKYIPEQLFLKHKNKNDIAERIFEIKNLSNDSKIDIQNKLFTFIKENHDLSRLVKKIVQLYNT